MSEKEIKKSAHERLFKFNLQEEFDLRYVLQSGDYKYIKALVIGVAGLVLTAVVVLALSTLFHSNPSL